ncbi:MAG: hypothetical protein AB1422_03870 [bacterium]
MDIIPKTVKKTISYQLNEVLRKRPYIKKEWCCEIIENPIRFEKQEGNRYRFWGEVKELDNRIFRIVTLEDKLTIHNAFPDRRFKE